MKKLSYQQVVEIVQRKNKLENAAISIEQETWSVSTRIDSLKLKLPAAKEAVSSLRSTVEVGKDKRYTGQLQESIKKLEGIESELNKANSEMDTLKKSLAELDIEILPCLAQVVPEHFQEHQKNIEKNKLEIEKVVNLIAEQQHIITIASNPVDSTQELMRQREGILAEIALGKNDNAKLENLDKRIEALNSEDKIKIAENNKAASVSQQTIAGLNPIKAGIEAELNHLNALTPKLFNHLAIMLAHEAAEKYKQAAIGLSDAVIELKALDGFIAEQGIDTNTGVIPKEWRGVQVANLSTMNIEGGINRDDVFYANTIYGGFSPEIGMAQLKQRLINQGIQIK